MIDHFQTTVSLATKSQVIGISQESLQIGFILAGQCLLEYGLEVDFNGIDKGLDPLLAGWPDQVRPLGQVFLSLLEQDSEPCHPRRREVLGLSQLLHLVEQV